MSSTGTAAKQLVGRLIPWLLGAATFLLVASTASHYGLGWDEPNYFHASDLEIQWILDFGQNLLRGEVANSLADDKIKAAWHWQPYYVPHPPFSRIVSGLTKTIFSSVLDKFTAYRLAPALFFALLVTLMYLWMSALFDRAAGIFAALALVVIPNLFGFAHFAVTDMALASLWFLTVYCFWRGLNSWRWSVILGIVWGLALATKFPAFLIPIPLLLWAHLYHRRAYGNNVIAMMFLSPMVMVASNPYFWHQTLPRIVTFLYDSVSRAYRPETNFTIFFYNQLLFSTELPRYYPFFITAVTTPETILFLCLAGIVSIFFLKAQRDAIMLFLVSAVFITAMSLLPGAVLHDGMRQLLSALPFLAALAGCGFFFLTESLTRWSQRIAALQRISHLRVKLPALISFLALFPAAVNLWTYHPYELGYYNRFVGGMRGAYERGLEVTYFLEALTPDFLRRLNKDLPPNARVNASFANFMFRYYQDETRLRPDIRITDNEDFDYYILLNRRSTFSERDWAFLATKPYLYDALRLDGAPLIVILQRRSHPSP